MTEILVLAETGYAAQQEIKYQALRIAPPRAWHFSPRQLRTVEGWPLVSVIAASPPIVTREIAGRRLDEIFIIGDWTRWHFGAPGAFSVFAGSIALQRHLGAKIKWERDW